MLFQWSNSFKTNNNVNVKTWKITICVINKKIINYICHQINYCYKLVEYNNNYLQISAYGLTYQNQILA
jgi:hypothetical protein